MQDNAVKSTMIRYAPTKTQRTVAADGTSGSEDMFEEALRLYQVYGHASQKTKGMIDRYGCVSQAGQFGLAWFAEVQKLIFTFHFISIIFYY